MKPKNLISIKDLTAGDLNDIFSLGRELKKSPARFSSVLKGKSLALIFEKPSNRTYVSFQVGMYQLGGNAVYLGPEHIKLGIRETIHDVAKTLSRYVDAIVLRTFGHQTVLDMVKYSSVPVINGLSDLFHPCQALADIFTVREKFGTKDKVSLCYVGDGNNVCNSLLYACSKTGIDMRVASPSGYEPDKKVFQDAKTIAGKNNCGIEIYRDPFEAAEDADILYTDVWTSMGQESEKLKRKKAFRSYQVNKKLVSKAAKNVLIMHCLPAHRGEEITDEVIDNKNSIVFDQAENRLHVEKAVLMKLLAG